MHVSQLCSYRVENPDDVVDAGQKVWVKVVELRDMNKISLSMKVVDQATGEDLDPANRDVPRGDGGGGGGRGRGAPIKAGDELDPVEAMRRGVAPVGKKRFLSEGDYELIEDDDPALQVPAPAAPPAPPPVGRGRGATMPSWMIDQLKKDVKAAKKKKKKCVAGVCREMSEALTSPWPQVQSEEGQAEVQGQEIQEEEGVLEGQEEAEKIRGVGEEIEVLEKSAALSQRGYSADGSRRRRGCDVDIPWR